MPFITHARPRSTSTGCKAGRPVCPFNPPPPPLSARQLKRVGSESNCQSLSRASNARQHGRLL